MRSQSISVESPRILTGLNWLGSKYRRLTQPSQLKCLRLLLPSTSSSEDSGAEAQRPGAETAKTSSQQLIPIPGFLPPGYSSLSCVFQCFLSLGEIQKSGVGITFLVPMKVQGPRAAEAKPFEGSGVPMAQGPIQGPGTQGPGTQGQIIKCPHQ